jgi:recombination associated protein RdgC
MVFEFDANWEFDETSLEETLFEKRLRSCPKHAFSSQGWAAPIKDLPEQLAFHTNKLCFLSLVKESRVLPNSVVKKEVADRAADYEHENAKDASAALKRQFKEDVEFELLPKAFTIQKKTEFYIDLENKRVLIDTSSGSVASYAIAELVKSLGTLNLSPLKVCDGTHEIFADWIRHPSHIPSSIELGKQCKLISLKEGKSAYQCKDLEYHLEDVETLLDNGLQVSELELIWQDRMSFVLTHNLELKRVKYLETIESELKEQQDIEDPTLIFEANLRLMQNNFSQLINFFKEVFAVPTELSVSKKSNDNASMVA